MRLHHLLVILLKNRGGQFLKKYNSLSIKQSLSKPFKILEPQILLFKMVGQDKIVELNQIQKN